MGVSLCGVSDNGIKRKAPLFRPFFNILSLYSSFSMDVIKGQKEREEDCRERLR